MRLKALFIVVFSCCLLPVMGQSPTETRKLADLLYANERYTEALSAYQRVAFFSRPVSDPSLMGKIADCFYQSGDLYRALEYYDHAYFASNGETGKNAYLFTKIFVLLELENYHAALIELLDIETDPDTRDDYRKELYLGAVWFGLEDFEAAGQHLAAAIPQHKMEQKQAIQTIFTEQKNFTKPDPKTARILSIIFPGTGQLYAGEPGAALNSFLLTGALVGLVYYLTIRIHPVEAILTGIPWFQRYYQGGFDQAAETARKNRERKRNASYQEAIQIIQIAWAN